MNKLYLIGSLRNEKIPGIANEIRKLNIDVFDDWYASGPEADDYWQAYEKGKGNTFSQALDGTFAEHVFHYDLENLDNSDLAVLVLPAGKSGHLEFGYMLGMNKVGYILLDGEPDRYDVMYNFADGVFNSMGSLLNRLGMWGKK